MVWNYVPHTIIKHKNKIKHVYLELHRIELQRLIIIYLKIEESVEIKSL